MACRYRGDPKMGYNCPVAPIAYGRTPDEAAERWNARRGDHPADAPGVEAAWELYGRAVAEYAASSRFGARPGRTVEGDGKELDAAVTAYADARCRELQERLDRVAAAYLRWANADDDSDRIAVQVVDSLGDILAGKDTA